MEPTASSATSIKARNSACARWRKLKRTSMPSRQSSPKSNPCPGTWDSRGEINAAVVRAVLHSPHQYPEGYRSIVLWLYNGGKNVFLQDANNLIIRTQNLVEMLTYLKKVFPSVERITTYSRAKTIARKSLAELQALHAAGLSRIHIGLKQDMIPFWKTSRRAYGPGACHRRKKGERGGHFAVGVRYARAAGRRCGASMRLNSQGS